MAVFAPLPSTADDDFWRKLLFDIEVLPLSTLARPTHPLSSYAPPTRIPIALIFRTTTLSRSLPIFYSSDALTPQERLLAIATDC